jgi:hypothetical protein
MKNGKSNIGSFGELSASDKSNIYNWFNTEFVLFFYFCLYSETNLANRFEMSDLLIKRRNVEMKLLNKICDKTGYTPEYLLSRIKTTLPTLYKTLPTPQAFKDNVEAGKFTGISRVNLKIIAEELISTFCGMLVPDFEDLYFDTEIGTPNFKTDFTLKIIDNPNDIYNPTPPVIVTPAAPVTPETPIVNTGSFSLSTMALPLVIGGVALLALFRKK